MSSHEYVDVGIEGACPQCGATDEVARIAPADGGPPVPRQSAGKCRGCGYRDEPLSFAYELYLDDDGQRLD